MTAELVGHTTSFDHLTLVRAAAHTVSGHRVVSPRPDGAVEYADASVLADAARPLWLTLGAAVAGDPVSLASVGIVSEPSWSWSPGELWLGLDGQLVATPDPAGLFLVQLAVVATPTSIAYAPGLPIILAA